MEIQYYSKLHSQQLILEDGEIFWILTLDRENMIYQQMFQPFMVSSNLVTRVNQAMAADSMKLRGYPMPVLYKGWYTYILYMYRGHHLRL